MREILFRGRNEHTGWVYGDLRNYEQSGAKAIFSHDILHRIEVVPETVGQYTGLIDKNGKKIFEGDILKNTFFTKPQFGVVKFGKHNPNGMDFADYSMGFFVDWKDDFFRNDLVSWIEKAAIEVIGNIHDNPELLEVTE